MYTGSRQRNRLPFYPGEENAPSCGSGGYVRTGIGWYRRGFCFAKQENSRYSLRFDGVCMNCDVWLNGRHAGMCTATPASSWKSPPL